MLTSVAVADVEVGTTLNSHAGCAKSRPARPQRGKRLEPPLAEFSRILLIPVSAETPARGRAR